MMMEKFGPVATTDITSLFLSRLRVRARKWDTQPGADYVSIKALSRRVGLSERTLSSLPFPRFKVGRRVLVNVREFEAWLARHHRAGHRGLDDVLTEIRAARDRGARQEGRP